MCVAQTLKVLKFGGTSVGSVAQLQSLVRIVSTAAETDRVLVVVSAVSGVTNQLAAALEDLEQGTFQADRCLETLRIRHLQLASSLLQPESQTRYAIQVEERLHSLKDLFIQVHTAEMTSALQDAVLAHGERLSAPLVALALWDAGLVAVPQNATAFIRTDAKHGEAQVAFEPTMRQIQQWYRGLHPTVVPVVTGFIGATEAGMVTTLGRGGSDYTAALMARALEASVMERWTDTDGIYTEDPRHNAKAQRLPYLVLEEAWAWNHAGRLGMHRKALDPLVAVGIPVHVRSTDTPQEAGTLILPETCAMST